MFVVDVSRSSRAAEVTEQKEEETPGEPTKLEKSMEPTHSCMQGPSTTPSQPVALSPTDATHTVSEPQPLPSQPTQDEPTQSQCDNKVKDSHPAHVDHPPQHTEVAEHHEGETGKAQEIVEEEQKRPESRGAMAEPEREHSSRELEGTEKERNFNRPVKLEKINASRTVDAADPSPQNEQMATSESGSTRGNQNKNYHYVQAALRLGERPVVARNSSPCLRKKRSMDGKSEAIIMSAKEKTEFFNSLVYVPPV